VTFFPILIWVRMLKYFVWYESGNSLRITFNPKEDALARPLISTIYSLPSLVSIFQAVLLLIVDSNFHGIPVYHLIVVQLYLMLVSHWEQSDIGYWEN